MNTVKEIERINARELASGADAASSWHAQYKNSAWVYLGGLPYELVEGDVLCVMSQFGEARGARRGAGRECGWSPTGGAQVEDIHLLRDEATGRSKGFAFLKCVRVFVFVCVCVCGGGGRGTDSASPGTRTTAPRCLRWTT